MSDFNIIFPIQKIDKERRIVKGIATADNVDLEDDVISYDGSVEAFSGWVGNIREMHQPIAVGKLVEWNSVPVMHKGIMYQGIEVSVYISKGAEDTWQKILDGTLRGFSIGGGVIEKERIFDERLQRSVNVVKRYVLGELSVVDNPCNPAGMFSMIKSVDGKLQYVAEDKSKSVYYCATDDYASFDATVCPVCMAEMSEIGHSEILEEAVIAKMIENFKNAQEGDVAMSDLQKNSSDGNVDNMSTTVEFTDEQKKTVLSKLGDFFFGRVDEDTVEKGTSVDINSANGTLSVSADGANGGTGGGTVIVNIGAAAMQPAETAGETEENETKSEVVEGTSPVDAAQGVAIEDPINKGADGEDELEVVEKSNDEGDEEMDLEKVMEALGSLLDEKLEKVKTDITTEVDAKIEKSVEAVKAESAEKIEAVTADLEKVANSGAISKSVEIADEEVVETEKIEKSAGSDSFWGNIFVPAGIAEALGYDS